MKKVGLAVCYDTKNFGSQIQVLATIKKVEELGVISPVVEISVAYRKQVFFDDEIRIRVGIKQYNGISLEFNYEFFNASRNEICTTAYSRHCFLKEGKLIALKKELPELNRIITDCL